MRKKIYHIYLLLTLFSNTSFAVLQTIPDEVVKEHVLPYLSYQDLIKLRAANKRFYELANKQILEKKLIRFYLDKEKITHEFRAFKKMLKKQEKILPENTVTVEIQDIEDLRETIFVIENPKDIKKIIKRIKNIKKHNQLLTRKEKCSQEICHCCSSYKDDCMYTGAGCLFCGGCLGCWPCILCGIVACCIISRYTGRSTFNFGE